MNGVDGSSLFAAALCVPRLTVATAEQAISALAKLLLSRGCVLPSFEKAALQREKRSPTGLPLPGAAIALPHAEPEHVAKAAVAIALLEKPVRFRQMGSPAVTLDAKVVVMPALSSKDQAAAGLSALLELLQDQTLLAALLAATTPDEMLAAVTSRPLPGGGG